MIYIVDTGSSNKASVERWLKYHKIPYGDMPNYTTCEDLIFIPGVGNWDDVILGLRASGQWETLLNHKHIGGKFVGICLGFQLLMTGSEEGTLPGLGLFDCQLRKFSSETHKVPHVGFNEIRIGHSDKYECYFTHSYYLPVRDFKVKNMTIGITNYVSDFISYVESDRCLAVQFHPEKSSFGGGFFVEKLRKLSGISIK